MSLAYNAPETHVVYWDTLVNHIGEPECVPEVVPHAGGFEYFVVPAMLLQNTHATGGYDAYNSETDTYESLVVVGDGVPKHVRGMIVAHLLLHKVVPDSNTPNECVQHDKLLQSAITEYEPSLMEPYFRESHEAYTQGRNWLFTIQDSPYKQLMLSRYENALRNSASRGALARAANETRKKLAELGLEMPSDDVALRAVDKKTGDKTIFTLQTEAGTKHKCRSCSHPIAKGSQRITTTIQNPTTQYDHHHYHPGCVTHLDIGHYGAFALAEPIQPH